MKAPRPWPRRPWLGRAALGALVLALAVFAFEYDRRQNWQDRTLHGGWRVQHHAHLDLCRLLDASGALKRLGRGETCRADLKARRGAGEISPPRPHLVLLLHGMGRSPRMFTALQEELAGAGFDAVALAYPSLDAPIAAHAEILSALLDDLEGVERVSFVTHSLGGLVVRELFRRPAPWQARLTGGRVVMLAPPNQGSQTAETLGRTALFGWILGPSARQLAAGAGPDLPQPPLETAVIAGVRGDGEGWNDWLEGDDDGLVAARETRLESAVDHAALRAFHSFIAAEPAVRAATINFLMTGHLDSAPATARAGRDG